MGGLVELRNDIAASIYILPCTEEELFKRDFLLNRSKYGLRILIRDLENIKALYYRGNKMYIRKKWAKNKLAEYDLF